MTQPDLLTVCATAFVAVMTLLMLLAGMIRLLTVVFPGPEEQLPDRPGHDRRPIVTMRDAALLAAVHSAAAAAYPGMAVTRIEEVP